MSPILHLDTDSAFNAYKNMWHDFGEMKDALWHLQNDTDNFLYQGGWTGPARDEFVSLWEKWRKDMDDHANQLAVYQDNLKYEIQKWNEASDAPKVY